MQEQGRPLIDHILTLLDSLRASGLTLGQLGEAGPAEAFSGLDGQSLRTACEIINFMDEMPGGFLIYRADGEEEILYANRGLLRLLQCEDMAQFREMTGNSFRGLVHPDDLEQVEESIARQISASHYDLDYVEYRVIRRDGTVRWIEDYGHFANIPSAGGIFYVFLGDATEKRYLLDLEREQIYQENRRRLEVIEGLSINYESILYVDLDRDSIQPYRLSERTRVQFQEKLQPLSFQWYMADYTAVWVHPEDREMVARETSVERIRERLSREKTFYINYRVICRGELQFLQLRFVNVGGQASQLVMGYRRVDEEVRQEMEQKQTLSQALVNANLAVRAKNTFLSNISHDMRTPLNAISGFTALARRNLGDRQAVENYLSQVEAASQQLLALINDILEISRLEQGNISMEVKSFDLVDAMQTWSAPFQAQAQAGGKDFRLSIDVKNVMIKGDPARLGQIINNLVSNAMKFTKAGDRVSVTLRQMDEGRRNNYLFTVEDTGAGMSEEFLPKLFDPYEREIRFGAKDVMGTGLGMPIVKNLVTRMGGQITASSTLGKGTVFSVTLPFDVGDAPQTAPAVEAPPAAQLEGRHILLAEDNFLNMEIATELLQMRGAQVTQAENGREAVDAFRKEEPYFFDAILMDMQMPEMDGCQATEAIRALDRPDAGTTPIVALTANAFAEDISRTAQAGMDAHLAKPINIELLCATLTKLMAHRGPNPNITPTEGE